MSLLINTLLEALTVEATVVDVAIGGRWVMVTVEEANGQRTAGLASIYERFEADGSAWLGREAGDIAGLACSNQLLEAAVGVATINALQRPDPSLLHDVDAADWLAAQGRGKNLAIVGRFPFIEEEIRPVARQIWVFEQQPRPDEFAAADLHLILPQADIVAITGSSLVNHTIDQVLAPLRPGTTLMMLGATTPLSPRLLALGFHLLSGVQVVDIPRAAERVSQGCGFREIQGLRRVSLMNRQLNA